MKFRNASFFYLTESFVEDYKKKIINYLKEQEEKIKEAGEPDILIDLYNGDKMENKNPTGHIFINDFIENSDKFEDVCKYILSKDRKFIPLVVACNDKRDYSLIEMILKDNYSYKGRLTTGILGIGLLTNERIIKRE